MPWQSAQCNLRTSLTSMLTTLIQIMSITRNGKMQNRFVKASNSCAAIVCKSFLKATTTTRMTYSITYLSQHRIKVVKYCYQDQPQQSSPRMAWLMTHRLPQHRSCCPKMKAKNLQEIFRMSRHEISYRIQKDRIGQTETERREDRGANGLSKLLTTQKLRKSNELTHL